MSTFVLLPGAGSTPWYWHRVAPILEQADHHAITPDLPVDDDTAGLDRYVEVALAAIADCDDELIVVAQSMGAYTAPLIAEARPVERLMLVAPMVPAPHESPGEWWDATGQPEAARPAARLEGRDPDAPFDPVEVFLHDVPPDVAAEASQHVRSQSDRPFRDGWPLERWPAVPTHAIIGSRDRLFPASFQRRVIAERLGLEPVEIDTGHLPALARPQDLAPLLLGQ
jgi:alpha-beta hydrolase superfamily lysophospholipase